MKDVPLPTETLLAELTNRPGIYMIGIAGIPGSGKTTLAQSIASRISGAAVTRLTKRHVETGVSATPEEGRPRAVTSDRLNTEAILADGCRERAHLILQHKQCPDNVPSSGFSDVSGD